MTRVVVPISMPVKFNREITRLIKKKQYASKSEYFRDLARDDLYLAEIEESRREYSRGEYFEFKTAKSAKNHFKKFRR